MRRIFPKNFCHRIDGAPGQAARRRARSPYRRSRRGQVLPDILWEVLPEREAGDIVVQMRTEPDVALWDAFVSHASEDKDAFVRPLVEALQGAGLRLWYDELSLAIGDSLRRSIDKGLSFLLCIAIAPFD